MRLAPTRSAGSAIRTGALCVLALTALLSSCTVVREAPSGPAAPVPSQDRPGREETPRVVPPTRPAITPPRTGAGRSPLPLPDEVRALWVVRTTLTHPDSIRAMVDRASTSGFNTLLVQVRGRGDAYYQSRWEPKPQSVLLHGSTFDPLSLVIQEAHARGLGVHAWVNAHLVGGTGSLPTDPLHLIRSRPDLLAVPRVLARELYGMDPATPRFAEALLRYAQQNTDRIEGMYTAP